MPLRICGTGIAMLAERDLHGFPRNLTQERAVKALPAEFAWVAESCQEKVGAILDKRWKIQSGIEAYEVAVWFERGNVKIAIVWPIGYPPTLTIMVYGSPPQRFELSADMQSRCEARRSGKPKRFDLNDEYRLNFGRALEQLAANIPTEFRRELAP